MRLPLKSYQYNAIHDRKTGILPMTLNVLNDPDKAYVMILKSIMGSGKTVIAADYIEELFSMDRVDRGNKDTCILWLSKGNGKLHMQSSDKLQNLIETHDVQIFGIESSSDFNNTEFEDKQVYVINWEKLKEKKSNLLDFTENPNIQQALKNTDVEDMNFVFIVDEFHLNYEQSTYNRMVELFRPVFILGMTATPSDTQMGKADFKHIVPVNDVIAAGMIKKGICFNTINDFDDKSISSYNSVDEFFLRMSLKQRDVLEEHYRAVGSDVIPLLLIQFDDDVNNEDIIHVKDLLDTEYNNNENNDYAIWITDNVKGDERLRSSDDIISTMANNRVKVLLFKQAVATGWDCPRASVLLRYRKVARQKDAKAVSSFDIQTLGRIVRMPEPSVFEDKEIKHYSDEALNYGYVYVPSQKYELEDEFKKAYDGTDFAKRPSSRSQAILQQTINQPIQASVQHTSSLDTQTVQQNVYETGYSTPVSKTDVKVSTTTTPEAKNVSVSEGVKETKTFYDENKEYIEHIETALKGKNYKITNVRPDAAAIESEIKSMFMDPDIIKVESDDTGVEKVTFISRKLDINDDLLEAAIDSKKKADIKKDEATKEISVNLENPIVAYTEADKLIDRTLKSKRYDENSDNSDNIKHLLKTNIINKFKSFVADIGQTEEERLGQVGRIVLKNQSVIIQILSDIDDWIVSASRYIKEPSDFVFGEPVNEKSDDTETKSYDYEALPIYASNPEKVFAELLNQPNNNVQFWYKCPDKGSAAFVVAYDKVREMDRGRSRTKTEICNPDFIVAFKDKSIGIYETKSKNVLKEKEYDEEVAIRERIHELNQNTEGYRFFGGLIRVDIDNKIIIPPHSELGLDTN